MEKANDRIREFRLAKRMTQEEFSLACGLNIQHLKRIEDGKCTVKTHELNNISKAFDVSADYLLGIDRYPHPIITTLENEVIWSAIEKMSQQEVKRMIDILKSST